MWVFSCGCGQLAQPASAMPLKPHTSSITSYHSYCTFLPVSHTCTFAMEAVIFPSKLLYAFSDLSIYWALLCSYSSARHTLFIPKGNTRGRDNDGLYFMKHVINAVWLQTLGFESRLIRAGGGTEIGGKVGLPVKTLEWELVLMHSQGLESRLLKVRRPRRVTGDI